LNLVPIIALTGKAAPADASAREVEAIFRLTRASG
jgi:hypothetical protein